MLTITCPNCDDGPVRTLHAKVRTDGSIYRRYRCSRCTFAYSTVEAVTKFHRRKFTPADVLYIRSNARAGTSTRSLAYKFNVTRSAIQQLVRGQTYKERA